MEFEMPKVPLGSGKHPICLVVISANNLAASSAFYAKLFGWLPQPMSADLIGIVTPAGPTAAFRSNVPDGFPAMVPYIGVPNVDAVLKQLVAAGGTIERATWSVPGVGKLARFKDVSGTLYGLTDGVQPIRQPHMPMPIGSNPKPPSGAICSTEMHAVDREAAAHFFGQLFGWGTRRPCRSTWPSIPVRAWAECSSRIHQHCQRWRTSTQ